jgi:cobalt-zinc-cadmium efflux system membrane fusion protein
VAEVTVTLSEEAVKRAGLRTAPVGAGTRTSGLRAPGTIQPNAYQQDVVTPLVSGRVTRVDAELGQVVRRGQTLAQVLSPELAEAQTRYVTARAELAAHEQELARTEKLAGIGAASRQELERIHAEHTARRSGVESAAARLRLLGLSGQTIEGLAPGSENEASVDVPAPIAGVVTERAANVGVNVDSTTALFTVTDLSTVWVVVDLYEKDFSRVRVGSPATIVTRAYPNVQLAGRVSYIDPQVNPQTRTARARIQVPNPSGDLRLGMYAEAVFGDDATELPVIPRAAVQNLGDRTVVYLVDSRESGKFIERQVQLGNASGENVSVVSGLEIGDIVVTQGSFAVRAERERLGGGPSTHEMR